MKRILILTAVLSLAGTALMVPTPCRAQTSQGGLMSGASVARTHTYALLRRDPLKAAAWDVLLPGAGSVYVGLYINTIISAVVSVAGAALWVQGAVADNDATYWTGVGLFTAGRTYGIVSAAAGAQLLNRALRRQLEVAVGPPGFTLRF